jgi:hypothetical protein
MIDVGVVAANGLWVLGLSLVLAALSWAYWRALEEGERLRRALARGGPRRTVDVGVFLFCAGLVATSRRTWEGVVWAALTGAWLIQALFAARNDATQSRRDAETQGNGGAGDEERG